MILKNLMKITNNHHKQTPFRHRSLCLKLWIIKKQLMSLSKFKIIVPKKKQINYIQYCHFLVYINVKSKKLDQIIFL